jgi:hypothetical protein
LVNVIDAVPTYEPGEDVFLFLGRAADGALRTSGMFFGKYQMRRTESGPQMAVRDLSGRGLLLGRRNAARLEEISRDDLAAVAASVPLRSTTARNRVRGPAGRSARRAGAARSWLAEPPELERLVWGEIRRERHARPAATDHSVVNELAPFTMLSLSSPARWNEPDTSTTIWVDIQQSGNPLSDGPAAVAEIQRGMTQWNDVPEARIVLQVGDPDADFTSSNNSPASSYPPGNIVLFDDPYDDVSDPNGCGGVLAIGGYWRFGSPQIAVNGETFYPARRLYVIFNNNFECVLANPDNLAEVATHEIGHGIGFGHSTVTDSAMRSSIYGGGRGARLGDDDRDAAHCTYPHSLSLDAPSGGESWAAGSQQQIQWSGTTDAAGDPGVVDLELSTDGGSNWSVIRSGEPNDGAYTWTVPSQSGNARVRVVRHNLVSPTPDPFPSACSEDRAGSDFSITATTPVPGTIPDGAAGAGLRVERAGQDVRLTWDASCSAGATQYAIYQGSVAALRAATWDHTPVTCAAGTDLDEVVVPQSGSSYFLVAPLAGSSEGAYGLSAPGILRPPSAAACASRDTASCS